MASSAPHHQEDERALSPGHFEHAHKAVCSGVLISSFLGILEVGADFEGVQDWAAEQSSVSANKASLQWRDHRMPCRGPPTFEQCR